MKLHRRFTLLWSIGLLLLACSSQAQAALQILWKDDPIPVDVKTSVEKRIDFPEAIEDFQVPDSVRDVSNIELSPKGILLLTVNADFQDKQRLFAKSVSGQVYILDLTASDNASTHPIKIVDKEVEKRKRQLESASALQIPEFLLSDPDSDSPASQMARYVQYTRFGLAHHIGPKRLIPNLPYATTTTIEPVPLEHFIRSNPAISVTPLLQWKIHDLYLTTAYVNNTGTLPFEFDARAIRGHFEFVATASLTLTQERPATVWALLSKTPFTIAVTGANP